MTETAHEPKTSENQFYFFWRTQSPFSQWHDSRYELNGFTYTCAEQGMMHGKALLFEDHNVADLILHTTCPRTMKELGRKVKGFDAEIWEKNRERIVYENSLAKFTQNQLLLEALLSAEGLLVEAAPNDAIWGIGLAEAKARTMSSDRWPGLNLLGKILTQVRDEIRSGAHDELMYNHASAQES